MSNGCAAPAGRRLRVGNKSDNLIRQRGGNLLIVMAGTTPQGGEGWTHPGPHVRRRAVGEGGSDITMRQRDDWTTAARDDKLRRCRQDTLRGGDGNDVLRGGPGMTGSTAATATLIMARRQRHYVASQQTRHRRAAGPGLDLVIARAAALHRPPMSNTSSRRAAHGHRQRVATASPHAAAERLSARRATTR